MQSDSSEIREGSEYSYDQAQQLRNTRAPDVPYKSLRRARKTLLSRLSSTLIVDTMLVLGALLHEAARIKDGSPVGQKWVFDYSVPCSTIDVGAAISVRVGLLLLAAWAHKKRRPHSVMIDVKLVLVNMLLLAMAVLKAACSGLCTSTPTLLEGRLGRIVNSALPAALAFLALVTGWMEMRLLFKATRARQHQPRPSNKTQRDGAKDARDDVQASLLDPATSARDADQACTSDADSDDSHASWNSAVSFHSCTSKFASSLTSNNSGPLSKHNPAGPHSRPEIGSGVASSATWRLPSPPAVSRHRSLPAQRSLSAGPLARPLLWPAPASSELNSSGAEISSSSGMVRGGRSATEEVPLSLPPPAARCSFHGRDAASVELPGDVSEVGRRREDEPWRIGLPEPLALQVEALLLRVLRLAWAVQRAAFPVVTEEQGVRTYRVDQSDAPPISIAAVELDHPADVVTRFLFAVGTRKDWDTNVAFENLISKCNDHANTKYTCYTGTWLTSPRDIYTVNAQMTTTDGVSLIVSKSIPADFEDNATAGVVHANLLLGGFYISRTSMMSCIVLHISQMDQNPWLPVLARSSMATSPSDLARLRAYLDAKREELLAISIY
mmetsp:Transcript_24559/g.46588  ORF Transcript_24559/g.46588 Transcript_24559/m.46588 type:complete len:611 (+) Transcript_24559:256-2088(+)|eukprot:CAMPEP_0114255252 /NCGR_PEP_ID=MMETSP0058-20121206/17448_1 /TAXON_ID=36894 /ORGANISM="Pyramimonas parkeae, CCMP726" /LENGTH=610 /DNA_ID=CAMNT_0001369595 /DNA_START=173 /DNA_END=2005 /DNA_ORIENTATION=-